MKKKMQFSFWLLIVLAILLVVFSVQNAGPIKVTVLLWPFNVSLAVLLIGTFATGLVAGALYGYRKFFSGNGKDEMKSNPAKKDLTKTTKTGGLESDI